MPQRKARTQIPAGPGIITDLLAHSRSLRRAGDFPAALASFEQFISTQPGHLPARLDYAHTLRESGRIAEAERLYRLIARDHPGTYQALLGLARCARQRGEWDLASQRTRAAMTLAPRDREVRLEYAHLQRDSGALPGAELTYRGLLRDSPGQLGARLGLAQCARMKGDVDAALNHLRTAAANGLGAETPQSLIVAAELRDLGDYETARKLAYECLSGKSINRADIWASMGRIENRAGDHAAAYRAFVRARKFAPDRASLLIAIAGEAQFLGRSKDAKRRLLQATKCSDASAAAWIKLSELSAACNEFEQAFKFAKRANELQPHSADACGALAQALVDMGDVDAAFVVLANAIDQLGCPSELAIRYAVLLRRTGRLDEARELIARALKEQSRTARLWIEQMRIELAAGRGGDVRHLLDAIPATTVYERAEVKNACGLIAESEWQSEKALEFFLSAAALNSGNVGTQEYLARVHLIRCDLPAARHHASLMAQLSAPKRIQKGLSSNPSQSHIGQLLDEYLLDQDALTALQRAHLRRSGKRIEALKKLVRHRADHTPSAIALLVALRQSGYLTVRHDKKPRRSPIPKSICHFWDEAEPPSGVKILMGTWKRSNPRFQYCRFDHQSAKSFLQHLYPPAVLRAYLRAREPAMKADLFRLAYLYAEGGFYADADDLCREPLRDFVPASAEFVGWQEIYGTLGNNFIGAVPRHPVLKRALEMGVEAILRGDSDLLWLSTGPGLLTRAFASVLASTGDAYGDFLARTAILTQQEVARGITMHCFVSYKNTSRHWSQSSFQNQTPKR